MDGLTLRAVAAAAGERLAGARIAEARWISPGGLFLDFGRRVPGLVLAVHPSLFGLFAAGRKEVARGVSNPAARAMEKAVEGATLTGISMEGLERVVRLGLERVSPAGKVSRLTLVLEAMGRWSNLVLVEEPGGVVVAALKVIPPSAGGRGVMPGAAYRPPPAGSRPDPSAMSHEELAAHLGREAAGGGLAAALGSLAGISRETASRLSAAAGEGGPAEAARLLKAGSAEACLVPFFAECVSPRSVLEASGEFYRREAARLEMARRSGRLLHEADAGLGRLRELVRKLEEEMAEAGRVEQYRLSGDLLMAHLGEIRKGAARFVTDRPFGQPGERMEVPLDPVLSPQANAERLFRKARKMRIRAAHAEGRLREAKAGLARLEELRRRIGSARDREELEAAAADLARPAGKAASRPARPSAARERPPRRWLEYAGSGGWRIIVGRDAASNDYVMSRLAAPDDVWCHAEGLSGSHVVLKMGGLRGEPPPEALEEACRVAAYHSKGRGQVKVPVTWTLRKHVRKPKGAAPGLVVLERRRTLTVPPEIPPDVRDKRR